MLDLGWTEIMLIAGVAVLVISPKDLPRAMRTVGKYISKIKRTARGFQNQFNDAIREAELDDVRKDVEALGKIDPMAGIRKEVSKVESDISGDMAAIDKSVAESEVARDKQGADGDKTSAKRVAGQKADKKAEHYTPAAGDKKKPAKRVAAARKKPSKPAAKSAKKTAKRATPRKKSESKSAPADDVGKKTRATADEGAEA